MRTRPITTLLLLTLAGCITLPASAQKQTDIAASLFGNFTPSTTANTEVQTPASAAGGLLELRHIFNNYAGLEAAYAYNRANQMYEDSHIEGLPCPPPGGCASQALPTAVSANAHTITGAWILSKTMGKLRPYALAGTGAVIFVPSQYSGGGSIFIRYGVSSTTVSPTGPNLTTSATQFLYLFGGGMDWNLSRKIGLRLQYRFAMYKAPLLANANLYSGGTAAENNYTRSQQPALGIYYRF